MNYTENCTELFLDDIVKIYPLAKGDLLHSMPAVLQTNTVLVTDLARIVNNSATPFASLSELNTWLSGKQYFSEAPDDALGIQLREAATLRISTDRNVSGYQHTITINLPTKYYHEEERLLIHKLERIGHDFILVRQDGSLILLRYFSPAQKITHEADNAQAQISVSMKNLTGMQDITE